MLTNATLRLRVRCKTFSSLHEMPHARSDFLDRLARGIMHSSYGIGSVHSHTDEVCCSASLSCNKQHCTATESATDSHCCFSLGCAYTFGFGQSYAPLTVCAVNIAAPRSGPCESLAQILKKMIQIAHISLQLRSYNMGVCLSSIVHTTCCTLAVQH